MGLISKLGRVAGVLGLVLEIGRRKLGDITVGLPVAERNVRDEECVIPRNACPGQKDVPIDDNDVRFAIAIHVADGAGRATPTVIRRRVSLADRLGVSHRMRREGPVAVVDVEDHHGVKSPPERKEGRVEVGAVRHVCGGYNIWIAIPVEVADVRVVRVHLRSGQGNDGEGPGARL